MNLPRRRAAPATLLLLVALVAFVMMGAPGGADTVTAAPTTTLGEPAVAPTTTWADNPFIPEDANLSECISAVPKPGCGSEARGGWRQGLVFVVMMLAMVLVGWRIFLSVRRRDATR